ncbi:nucleotide exchange factor GrpE [Nocardia salmonicida]|uniref:nucleotide exchange factor GrpE n=1 Tax=Nocardia salmonicida TaxID=53431 RepID=UPI003422FFC2
MTDNTVADQLDSIRTELAGLSDLFKRRLLDDRGYRQLVESLQLRAATAEAGLGAEYLLPVVLQLAHLIDRAEQNCPDPFVASLIEELHAILETCGVQPFGHPGEPVDPDTHEIRSTSGKPGGPLHVDTLIRRGYTYSGKVVRPVLVDAVYHDRE